MHLATRRALSGVVVTGCADIDGAVALPAGALVVHATLVAPVGVSRDVGGARAHLFWPVRVREAAEEATIALRVPEARGALRVRLPEAPRFVDAEVGIAMPRAAEEGPVDVGQVAVRARVLAVAEDGVPWARFQALPPGRYVVGTSGARRVTVDVRAGEVAEATLPAW